MTYFFYILVKQFLVKQYEVTVYDYDEAKINREI